MPQLQRDQLAEDAQRDLRLHIRGGFGLLAALGLVLFGWGLSANIAGAVVAPGTVAFESSIKRVQHKEGGILSELLVKEGDQVKAGALLARIDSLIPGANLTVVRNQLEELIARRLRLEAERDGRTGLRPPPGAYGPGFATILAAETRLMTQRQSLQAQKKAQLAQQVVQTRQEIGGLRAQVDAQAAQRQLIEGELTGIRQLYDKGLATLPRLNALEREAKRLDGTKGELFASIAEANTRISQLQVQALQIDTEHLTAVMSELKEAEIKLAQLTQQKTTSEDELRRVEVRSPTDGQVQQLSVHTQGGVIGAGETLMMIVPSRDELIVEAKIDPQHIDQVTPGRPAKIRFTAFSAQDTPTLDATVDRVSADAQADERTGVPYYLARLRIDRPKLSKRARTRLVAGMPAEVQIATGNRTAISYFLKPLSDQLARTFRED